MGWGEQMTIFEIFENWEILCQKFKVEDVRGQNVQKFFLGSWLEKPILRNRSYSVYDWNVKYQFNHMVGLFDCLFENN